MCHLHMLIRPNLAAFFFYLTPRELCAFLEKMIEIRFSWQTYRPTPFLKTLCRKRLGVPLEVIVKPSIRG